MAYEVGRTRLLQGTLVGIGAWLIVTVYVVLLARFAFPLDQTVPLRGWIFLSQMMIMWPVALVGIPAGELPLVTFVLIAGIPTTLLLVGAGAVMNTRGATEQQWDAAKAGATIAAGYVLLCGAAFTLFPSEEVPIEGLVFALIFGGLLLPATLGALGGVLKQQLRSS